MGMLIRASPTGPTGAAVCGVARVDSWSLGLESCSADMERSFFIDVSDWDDLQVFYADMQAARGKGKWGSSRDATLYDSSIQPGHPGVKMLLIEFRVCVGNRMQVKMRGIYGVLGITAFCLLTTERSTFLRPCTMTSNRPACSYRCVECPVRGKKQNDLSSLMERSFCFRVKGSCLKELWLPRFVSWLAAARERLLPLPRSWSQGELWIVLPSRRLDDPAAS